MKKKKKTIAEIVEGSGGVRKLSGTGEVLILFPEMLSETEKAALADTGAMVLQTGEDLLKRIKKLEDENEKLKSLALHDELTGFYNYRFFSRQIEVEIKRTQRSGSPFILMMIDIDNFKALNDTFGHHEGNHFLKTAAERINHLIRPTDIACRYGGDEFAVIMPGTGRIDALNVANRLKQIVLELADPYGLPVSVSIGISEYSTASLFDSRELIESADRSLYKAKQSGKNRICFQEKPSEEDANDSVTADERMALFKP